MSVLAFLLRSSKQMFVLIVLSGLVAGVSNTGLLALINATLTDTAPSKPTLVPSFIGLCFLMLVSRVTSEVLLARLSQKAIFEMRMQLSRRILHTPLRRIEELGIHRLLAVLADDIPIIGNALTSLPVLCIHFGILTSCLIYLFWLSKSVFFGLLCFMTVGVLGYQLPMKIGLRHLQRAREYRDVLYKQFRALTEGAKELKLHSWRRGAFLSQDLRPAASSLMSHIVAGNSVFTVATAWGQVLFFIVVGLLLFGAPILSGIDERALIGYTLVILYLMTPLQTLLNTLPVLGNANVSIQKIETLSLALTDNVAEDDSQESADQELRLDSLRLADVTHSYKQDGEESTFILGPLDLILRRGEILFLVGGNGSGKTTLAKLLVGLYIPEAGELYLNGQLVTDHNREHYRQHFSVVFSDFYLFDRLPGTDDVDAKARDYLIQLRLNNKVQIKNGMISTTDLSQGQRKRLALLSAYLEDRPIYLFDEWAADQDPVFKEIFYLRILPELRARDKTVLVISHDDRYYQVADRIIKLDSGKIVSDSSQQA